MAFFAPSRLSDFFSTIWACAGATADIATRIASSVEVKIFISPLGGLAAHLLGAASRRLMLFDRVIEGGFAEIRLGERAPNLDLRYVRDVIRDYD